MWEQELYTPFKYTKLTEQFHYFDADNCIAGLNFACPLEATKFEASIVETAKKRLLRKRVIKRNKSFIIIEIDTVKSNNDTKAPAAINQFEISEPFNFKHEKSINSNKETFGFEV